jgi:hypothetical protein
MTVIPLPSSTILTVREVAEHWAQEIVPIRDVHFLINDMIRHWWLGNLKLKGPSRLQFLELLYQNADELLFVVSDDFHPTEYILDDDGNVMVDIRRIVPIPNSDPSSWDDANCAMAFEALSNLKDYQECGDLMIPGFHAALTATETDFRNWLLVNNLQPPKFWKASEVSVGCSWTEAQMEQWWVQEGHTNGTKARNAFMKLVGTKRCSSIFERHWKVVHWDVPRGRPKKS